ncbi:von Willebrand factor type A domain containing protein [Histomonas meleagridis]|uniref:von Willebrand factor type A domain containing protein n=1 Tax=Histomonas meleagridis TaxID=135588 RepID=UPI0035599107|nr:von Willebrand factor type A domain containing protein [Histomonas meleagridis]KAH0801160.1 von Willebrand factor type A domain containing protein [Histomonas meleagridis]
MTDNIPNEFLCPISLEIMKDPVIMPDGQTYEREQIEKALSVNPVSPLTRQPMSMSDAKTNYALKSLIDKYLSEQAPKTADDDNDESIPEVPISTAKINEITFDKLYANYTEDPKNRNNNIFQVVLQPNQVEARKPTSLIALIDVSGSMSGNSCQNVAGMEDLFLSRLQLVQHALNTILALLGDDDYITLIAFDDQASVVLQPTKTTAAGKSLAGNAVKSLYTKGCTNIWDALRLGIQNAKKFDGEEYNISILLFTDGEPNVNPPMGIIPTLTEELSDIPNRKFTISSFSFGYSIDSVLMENIAKLGNGIYGYCPDCTMVGTILINYMSNLLTTLSPIGTVEIKGSKYQGKHEISLYNGMPTNVVISIPKDAISDLEINVTIPTTSQSFGVDDIHEANSNKEKEEIRDQTYRYYLIQLISKYIKNTRADLNEALTDVQNFYSEVDAIQNRSVFLDALLVDLINDDDNHGQISKSFQKKFYEKWGKDYIRSFLRFHIVQQCGNFKDETLKFYEGEKFKEIRKVANKIFLNLPPPKGREISRDRSQGTTQFNRRTMTRFYNASAGCFNGEANVSLKDGAKKLVKDLKKGDILEDGGIVQCLIEMKIKGVGTSNCVDVNGVLLSPYHPIQIEGKWVFPITVNDQKVETVNYWYNLVLEGKPIVRLNGIPAITLGHNMEEGVLKHPYFGTDAVINALKKYDTYEEGKISIDEPTATRDESGLISTYF